MSLKWTTIISELIFFTPKMEWQSWSCEVALIRLSVPSSFTVYLNPQGREKRLTIGWAFVFLSPEIHVDETAV